MSGYNKKTGIFELTFTKANYWFRREDLPEECSKLNKRSMEFFACILLANGLEVMQVYKAFLKVKAQPSQIWEALSGQPSNPEREAHYLK